MGTINTRDGRLYMDFRFKGKRCREQTKVVDTPANRKKLEKLLAQMEQQMKWGTFDYAHHFPDSPRVEVFRHIAVLEAQQANLLVVISNTVGRYRHTSKGNICLIISR